MRIANFDTDRDIFVVAEIGNNHEGNFALAQEMIALAAEAGVDAVKFQTFKTEDFVSPVDPARVARLKSFELTGAQFAALSRQANEAGILFFSTPLDIGSVATLEPLVCAYKIASGDNDCHALMEAVARTGKPVILSSGMTDLATIRKAKSYIEGIWASSGVRQQMALLHCVSAYPVPDEQANVSAVATLVRELDCTVGYSDHTLGSEACLAAAALGARVIEKHFTKDKNFSDFRDHKLSADPAEMKALVKGVKRIGRMLGTGTKVVQPCEEPLLKVARRSARAARPLTAGAGIGAGDVKWLRPADGMPADKDKEILGRKLKRSLNEGDLILPEALD